MRKITGIGQKSVRLNIFICFIFAVSFFSGAGKVGAAVIDYRFDNWTTDDGLPQNSVLAVTQTRDGYLWLATFDGLVRFDGVRFTIFDKSNTPAVVGNRFTCLLEDRDGTLWAGSEFGGLIHYQNNTFERFDLSNGNAETTVRDIQQTTDGDLIAATDTEVFRRHGANDFEPFAPDGDPQKQRVLWSKSGAKWTIEPGGVSEERDGKTTYYRFSTGKIQYGSALYEDRERGLWFGAKDRFYRLRNGLIEQFDQAGNRRTIENAALTFLNYAFYEAADGTIYAGGEDGLTIFDANGGARHLTESDGLPTKYLRSIEGDREGNIWLGTLNRGIIRMNRKIISTFSTANGLLDNNINPIFADRAGQVWVGSKLLEKISGNQITHYEPDQLNHHDLPQAISEDHAGRIWLGFNEGTGYLERDKFTDLTDFFGKYTVNVIREDAAGRMWFGTDTGLIEFTGGVKTVYGVPDGLPNGNIKDIYIAENGTLWLASYGGLIRFENGVFTAYTERDGLSGNLVRTLTGEPDGTLWIGTYGGGLMRFKNGKFTAYTTSDGLFNNGVFRILDDGAGNFWMSSNRGIYRVAKQQLNDFADGKIASITSVAYGRQDGMLSTECNGGRQPAGARTADGRLWFPTQGGVVVVNPQEIVLNAQPPPVVIETIKIDNRPVEIMGDGITLSPNQASLEIGYTGLSLIKSEQVNFRYRLENLETDWTEARNRRSAYYSYLPPGDYVFTVIAANADGVWNDTGKSLRVRVIAPFYRTWWFLILIILLVAGAVYLFYRWRVANLEKKQAAQRFFSQQLIESQERERQRIAGELHDGLSQSLVIIKNRAMMSLSERENSAYVFEQIEEIVEAAGESLAEVRVIANNLRPFQIDRLGLTKAIEALVRKANSARLDVAAQLDNIDGVFEKSSEINLYRIVQESLNNIIKHSEATEARIIIRRTAGYIEVKIKDDGKGFDANAPLNNQSANGTGFGITGIYERARMFGATPVIESSAGTGTTIRLKISGAFG